MLFDVCILGFSRGRHREPSEHLVCHPLHFSHDIFDYIFSILNFNIVIVRIKILIVVFLERNKMKTYYDPMDLDKFSDMGKNAPELWKKFSEWYGNVFAEGALTEREKALIALAVSHAVQCPYCIDAYTQECLEKGSNKEQMTEAVHVAAAIRGGASLVHGVQMRNVVDKLSM